MSRDYRQDVELMSSRNQTIEGKMSVVRGTQISRFIQMELVVSKNAAKSEQIFHLQ